MKRTIRAVVLVIVAGSSCTCQAKDFTFVSTDPAFKVAIPNLPPLSMRADPTGPGEGLPSYSGSDGTYSVSIRTPAAGTAVTPLQCADSAFGQANAEPNMPSPKEIYPAQLNERTYIEFYLLPSFGAGTLHAYLVTAATTGTHCIEVHLSKVASANEDRDIKAFIENIGAASIE